MDREKELLRLAKDIQEMKSPVNPNLWAGIQSTMGNTAAASSAAAGKSAMSGLTWFGLSSVVVVAAGLVTWSLLSTNSEHNDSSLTSQQVENAVESNTAANQEPDNSTLLALSNKDENLQTAAKEQKADDVLTKTPDITPDKLNASIIGEEVKDEQKKEMHEPAPISNVSKVSESIQQNPQIKTNEQKVPATNSEKKIAPPPAIVEEPKKESNPVAKKELVTQQPEELEFFEEDQNETVALGEFNRLPNVFSPNGDGSMDEFFVETKNLLDYSLVVLNERGEVVWKTSTPDAKWNGVGLNGQLIPSGRYMYFIVAKDASGQVFEKTQQLYVQP